MPPFDNHIFGKYSTTIADAKDDHFNVVREWIHENQANPYNNETYETVTKIKNPMLRGWIKREKSSFFDSEHNTLVDPKNAKIVVVEYNGHNNRKHNCS